MANLYIIAGPNGAGKTTAAMTVLPEAFYVKEFVNADEIARGLSPLNPAGMAIEAGKIMLKRIEQLIQAKESFSIETTLASKNYVRLIKECQTKGYRVTYLPIAWNVLKKEKIINFDLWHHIIKDEK